MVQGTHPPRRPEDPEASRGGTVEGNLCFAHRTSGHPDPLVVDVRWGSPTRPHLGGDQLGRERDPEHSLAPYRPPA